MKVSTAALDREHHDDTSCVCDGLRCPWRVHAHQWPKALWNVSASQSRSNTLVPVNLQTEADKTFGITTILCGPCWQTLKDFEGTPRAQQLHEHSNATSTATRHEQAFDVISQLKQLGGVLEHANAAASRETPCSIPQAPRRS